VREWDLGILRRQGVTTLGETVATLPTEFTLFVEVKPLAASDLQAGLGALAALVGPRGSRSRVISSSESVLVAVRRVLPGVALSLVFDEIPVPLPDGLELSPSHRLVEALLPAGVPLHPWTVNRPARMRELARLGVASITTNDPALAVGVLRG